MIVTSYSTGWFSRVCFGNPNGTLPVFCFTAQVGCTFSHDHFVKVENDPNFKETYLGKLDPFSMSMWEEE